MMKRYILIIILIIAGMSLYAQNEVDALRFSTLKSSGTARYNAMSGAFTSLGGDFSVLSQNPAGLGIYRSSEFTITPAINYNQSSTTFSGNKEDDFNYNISLNNIGYVGSILINSESNSIKSLNFGFGYNQLMNYNRSIDIKGVNNNGSITDVFAAMSNGTKPASLSDFYEWPAYYTYLTNPANADSTEYVSAYSSYGEQQSQIMEKSGNIGEYVFSMGMNIEDQVYLGATFGIQDVNYEQNIFYEEKDIDNLIDDFNSFSYEEKYETSGTGYNFKIGAIVRPVDWIRVSAAIHTPTFYNLHNEKETKFSSDFNTSEKSQTIESPLGVYDYNLTSPFKALGGVSFMILNQGLVSFDYEFLDYSISKLSGQDYSFDTENDAIQDNYRASHHFRGGLEYKLGMVSFRAGAAYFTSPYVSDQINGNSDFMQYSGGIGFRMESFFFDMAYVYQDSKQKYYIYEGYGYNSPVSDINLTRHSVMATLGFRF